jgi:hypothetical protein
MKLELQLKLEAEAFVQALRELGDLGFGVPQPLADAASFHLDLAASAAGELLVRLKPSDRLAVYMAALRAGNVDDALPPSIDSARAPWPRVCKLHNRQLRSSSCNTTLLGDVRDPPSSCAWLALCEILAAGLNPQFALIEGDHLP